MEKPTVYYIPTNSDYIVVGERADVHDVHNHPHVRSNWVNTSTVVAITDEGFETLNTKYVMEKA